NLDFDKKIISIQNKIYKPSAVTVEADWSAASYWFAFVALAKDAKITLPTISENSLQGDRVIVDVMAKLGVNSIFKNGELELTKKESDTHLTWDFKNCPDLAQTVLPVCAAKGIAGNFTGLESLRIKETDRIAALKNELMKIGATLDEPETGRWTLTPGKIESLTQSIETYHDHRMAMGFAPWATQTDVTILNPEVVNKSYPTYWEDLKSVGFTIL
ncbi:MAG TPA: 3-phosphoshikimate 1-carboxyvinyltransferase, partial [Cytophagales bacterium]|nr:3-phosphoshikimate 1-carboxyvinyltransferase [Cytophagales bacterium]